MQEQRRVVKRTHGDGHVTYMTQAGYTTSYRVEPEGIREFLEWRDMISFDSERAAREHNASMLVINEEVLP